MKRSWSFSFFFWRESKQGSSLKERMRPGHPIPQRARRRCGDAGRGGGAQFRNITSDEAGSTPMAEAKECQREGLEVGGARKCFSTPTSLLVLLICTWVGPGSAFHGTSLQLGVHLDVVTLGGSKVLVNRRGRVRPSLSLHAAPSVDRGGGGGPRRNEPDPFPDGRYDPTAARKYFFGRPWEAMARAVEITSRAGGLFFDLWTDELLGRAAVLEEQRAREAVQVIVTLGPTFVKIGQSLSVRGDLLPPAYIRELTTLQDRVPFFDDKQARAIVLEELGLDSLYEQFSSFSQKPVAAASLGQVYRATMRQGGQQVAVKVQRPFVKGRIACDLFLLRLLAGPLLSRLELFAGVSSMVDLIDELGYRFVNELDYSLEAAHAEEFNKAMAARGFNNVFAPMPVRAACSPRVLTCTWVEGSSLDVAWRTNPGDNEALTALCLNSYLTMMLDSGLLHCDPHPGNLLRTPDGRLCILDWGLVIRVDRDLQYALIEYIAHLTTTDSEAIPGDLEALGFVPPGREADVRASGLIDVLTQVLAELSAAGGAAALDVNKIVEKLVDITKEYGALFQIPPYFAYIIRAYTVLQGIGLQSNPNYSILAACYPYLARRLLTDPSPRTQKALKEMLYGSRGAERMDLQRLASLAEGAQDFSSSASLSSALSGTAAKDLADILLSPDGNYVQEVLIEEAAVLIEAFSRQALADMADTPAGRIASSTLSFQKAVADQLGPAAVLLGPALLPGQLAARMKPLVQLTEEDIEVLKSARKLLAAAGPAVAVPTLSSAGRPLSVAELQRLLRESLMVVQEQGPSARAVFNRLLEMLQARVKDRIRISAERALAASLEQQLPAPVASLRQRSISLPQGRKGGGSQQEGPQTAADGARSRRPKPTAEGR